MKIKICERRLGFGQSLYFAKISKYGIFWKKVHGYFKNEQAALYNAENSI